MNQHWQAPLAEIELTRDNVEAQHCTQCYHSMKEHGSSEATLLLNGTVIIECQLCQLTKGRCFHNQTDLPRFLKFAELQRVPSEATRW